MTIDMDGWDERFQGPRPDLEGLPVTYEHGEEWFAYDDGSVIATITASGRNGTIHDFYAKGEGLAGARTGIGRRAVETLRPHFDHLMAGGVGDHDADEPLQEQPAFLFWRAMLREGLIDEIDVMHCCTRIVRETMGRPVTVLRGQVVEPDPRDVVVAPSP